VTPGHRRVLTHARLSVCLCLCLCLCRALYLFLSIHTLSPSALRPAERDQAMRIAHRDLTPNNVMVSWSDVVKITDFGLSRRFGTAELLQSCVGTLMYSCPELAAGRPYTEKADIWAAGCLLYQMVTLTPPFAASNVLTLAKRIVAGEYPPLPDTATPLLHRVVAACLNTDPDARPDILGVCSLMSEQILLRLDATHERCLRLERTASSAGRARPPSGRRGANLTSSMGSDASAVSQRSPRRPMLPRWESGGSLRVAADTDEDHQLQVPEAPLFVRTPSGSGDDDGPPGPLAASLDTTPPRSLRRSISTPLRPMRPSSRGPHSSSAGTSGPASLAVTPPSRPMTATGSISTHRRTRRCADVYMFTNTHIYVYIYRHTCVYVRA
jgi:serine/threonine protein kinase